MLIDHSPQKENRSPSPKKSGQHKFNHKDLTLGKEIFNLRNNEDKIIHFDENDKKLENSLKKGHIDYSQFSSIKARLADRQFEVKKLEEDFAEYKLLSKLQQEKVLKRLKEELSTTKTRHNQEIKKWEGNYKEMMKKHDEEREQFRRLTKKHFQEEKTKEILVLKNQYQNKINQLQENLKNQKQSYSRALHQARIEFEQKISQIKKCHETEKRQINETYQIELKKTEEICENKIVMIQFQKKAEAKLVEETKQETTKNQQKYLFQIGKLERQRRKMAQQLDEVQMRGKVLQKKLENQNNQMLRLKEEHNSQMQSKNQQIVFFKNQYEKKIELQKLEIMKEHFQKTHALEIKFLELESLRETMINELIGNQRTLDLRFERRESKREDIQVIKEIGFKLAQKEKETHYLYNHLKMIQLEKDNNDKLYTRIFTANKEKRGSSHRNDRDVYSILKQSNTVDLRHMIKINRKDSKR